METLAFVRSGIVYLDASAVWYVGRYAQPWSRTANSPNNAYDLFIYTDNVDPSAGGGRYVGRSLRCCTGRKDTKRMENREDSKISL